MSKKNLNNLIDLNIIYVLGYKNVGKTNFIKVINDEEFEENINSKLGITSNKYKISDKTYIFKDLTDDDTFKFTKYYKKEIDQTFLLIVLFSFDDYYSYQHAKFLIKFTLDALNNNNNLPIFLIGNKNDIENKAIEENEIKKYVESIENCTYYSVSCKNKIGFEEIKENIKSIELNKTIILASYSISETEDEEVMKDKNNGASCNIF
jgi:GTPase SAR1 family protein